MTKFPQILDFFLKENLVTISDNIKYKGTNTELLADKIKINLITKDTKIFMNNKTEKIKTITLLFGSLNRYFLI